MMGNVRSSHFKPREAMWDLVCALSERGRAWIPQRQSDADLGAFRGELQALDYCTR